VTTLPTLPDPFAPIRALVEALDAVRATLADASTRILVGTAAGQVYDTDEQGARTTLDRLDDDQLRAVLTAGDRLSIVASRMLAERAAKPSARAFIGEPICIDPGCPCQREGDDWGVA
jgi:hypothetical protein